MRAELASVFMRSQLGIAHGPDDKPLSLSLTASHAGYLGSWLQVLQEDKTEILRAAADAKRICGYLQERT